MNIRNFALSLVLALGISAGDATACNATIPANLSACSSVFYSTLQSVKSSSCETVDSIAAAFARSANLSSVTLCQDLVKILAPMTTDSMSRAAEIIDFCGVGAWAYLALRAIAKYRFPSIRVEDALQSKFQRFLSHEGTAFVMTFFCVASFSGLWFDSSVQALVVSALAGGVPAVIGGLQFAFDWCWKAPRFLLRHVFGKCKPSQQEIAERNEKLIELYTKQREDCNKRLEELMREEANRLEHAD